VITGRSIGRSFGEEESDTKYQIAVLTKALSCSVTVPKCLPPTH
jgi:hypothetical protein